MSFSERRLQRQEMLETAFHDEFSLMNPDATKRKYKSLDKAVDLVNMAVVHRRAKNKERDTALTLARTKSALLNPTLLLEMAVKEQRELVAEEEFGSMQDRYVGGYHVLGTVPRAEKKNIYLEGDMYLQAANIICQSDPMKDYDDMHIGEVEIPPPTEEEVLEMARQRDVVAGLSKRNEMYLQVHTARATVRQTQLTISQKEDIVASTLQEVQKYRDVESFDWSLDKNNYVRGLKKEIVEHEKQLLIEQAAVKSLLEEAEANYPDMEFEVNFKFS